MTYISLYIMCMYACMHIMSVRFPPCPCGSIYTNSPPPLYPTLNITIPIHLPYSYYTTAPTSTYTYTPMYYIPPPTPPFLLHIPPSLYLPLHLYFSFHFLHPYLYPHHYLYPTSTYTTTFTTRFFQLMLSSHYYDPRVR